MFSKSVNLFFKNPTIGLPNVFIAFVSSVFARFAFDTTYLTNLEPNSITGFDSIPVELARNISQFLLYAILLLLFEPIIQAITISLSKNALNENKLGFSDTVKLSFKYYWRLLGVLVFKFFLLIGVFIGALLVMIPSISKFTINPESFPSSLLITLLILFLLIIFLSVSMLPIEPILVYEDLSLGDSIAKGFKFGFKKLLPLIGVSLILGIATAIINYIIRLFIGDITEVSSMIASYFSVFLTIYILCIYKESTDNDNNDLLQAKISDRSFLDDTNLYEANLSDDTIKDNKINEVPENTAAAYESISENGKTDEVKKDDSNKFIV